MEHIFSIELKSKKNVRHISVSNETQDHVLFEGSLGEIKEVAMVEGAMLEISGTKGVLRIDLSKDELQRLLSKKNGVA